jgi:hypothetical protein
MYASWYLESPKYKRLPPVQSDNAGCFSTDIRVNFMAGVRDFEDKRSENKKDAS